MNAPPLIESLSTNVNRARQGGLLAQEKDVVLAEGIGARYLAGSLPQHFISSVREHDHGRDDVRAAPLPAPGQPGSDA